MRLRSLDLERYGAFTGTRLAFRPDAALHLVYGPNEAGKSTCLSALADLLFGFERSTAFDFLHDSKDLRLGATLVRSDGAELAFRRRKGNKRTLLDPQEKELPDDALAPFLGSVGRDVFLRAFGLSCEALRASAEELGRRDGDLASALFTAASGLRSLADLRAQLEGEAAKLFASRAKDRPLNQALAEHDDARKSVREKELRSSDYKGLRAGIESAEARLREIGELKAQGFAKAARIKRLKAAQPILRRIDAEVARLQGLGDLPTIPSTAVGDLEGALGRQAAARGEHERFCCDEQEIAGEHAAVAVDLALLAQEARIDALYARTEAYRGAERDRPRLQAEAVGREAEIAELASRLGYRVEDLAAVRRPTDAEIARIEELMNEGRSLHERFAGVEASLRKEEAALKARSARAGAAEALVDPAPFRERLAALRPDLKKLETGRASAETLARDVEALGEEAARLRPAVGDLDTLARAPLPSPDTVERFRSEFDRLAVRAAQEAERHRSCTASVEALQQDLAALQTGPKVPTREELEAARAKRTQTWTVLRSALRGEGASSPEDGGAIVLRYEQLVSTADRLADEIAADAKRVFAIADHQRRLDSELKRQDDLAREVAAFVEATAAKHAEWQELWWFLEAAPLAPGEMASWRSAVASLLARRETLRAREASLKAVEEQGRALVAPLSALAGELRLAAYPGADALLLARYVEEALERVARTWTEAREAEALADEARRRILDLQSERTACESARERWRVQFDESVAAFGLKPGASMAEAGAAGANWKKLPLVQKDLEGLRKRIRGMERDILEPFDVGVRSLVAELAPDLAAVPSVQAVSELHARVGAAKEAKVRIDELARRLVAARAKVASAVAQCERTDGAVAALAASLNLRDLDLKAFVSRFKERLEIEAALRSLRQQLGAATEEHEGDLRAALVDFDADLAEGELARLAEANARLEREGQEAYAAKDRDERRLSEIEGGIGAEEAHQQRHMAAARIAEVAREYLVAKLASLMIGTALDRHAEQHRSPTMTRAGILFRTMTAGAFVSLEQALGDDDVPRLLARRASGKPLTPAEMSEGTRDQLCLALRLAYLQDFSTRAEPLPFIGDDLFATFDDERAGNGLETLASFGAAVQPILFTHHAHIVDIARARLGPKVDVVELGMGRAPQLAAAGAVAA